MGIQVLEKIKIVDKIKSDKKTEIIIVSIPLRKNSFGGKILGKTLVDWIKFGAGKTPCRVIDVSSGVSLMEVAREHSDSKFDYTILLMSCTPLLTKNTIASIEEYITTKEVGLCKLPVGYAYSNSYILDSDNAGVDSIYSQNIDEFYIVENKKQFNYALGVLQDRINAFHENNGVEIIKPNTVYIEADVDIDDGVVIYPNNSLKGATKISKGVMLKENNVIDNSKIGCECVISGSVIESSVLGSGVYVSPFSTINNSLIGANSVIGKSASIEGYKVDEGSQVAPNSVLN